MHRLDSYPKKELIETYRRTFGTSEGMEVLSHMLFELGTFQETNLTPEDMALKNYGSRLLGILGGGEVKAATMEALIGGLIRQPLPELN